MLLPHVSAVLAACALVTARNVPSQLPKRQVPSSHVLHERQDDHWGLKWTKRGVVEADMVLPMRVGLRQKNLAEGHQRLLDISTPGSSSYGQHMSPKEIDDFFAPAEAHVEAVMAWLIESGVSRERLTQSGNKQWIQFDASAGEAADILQADFFWFEHRETGSMDIAVDEYHLPDAIASHVDYITPGIRLRPGEKAKREQTSRDSLSKREVRPYNTGLKEYPQGGHLLKAAPLADAPCDQLVTPHCIMTQYNVSKGTTATKGNELGIFSSINQHWSPTDLDMYWSTYYPDIPNGTYPIEDNINGAIGAALTLDQLGLEAALDIQSSWPLIWPQKLAVYQVDDQFYERNQSEPNSPFRGFFNTFFDAIDGSYCTYSAFGETGDCTDPECLDPVYPDPFGYPGARQCGAYAATKVISISYGGAESDLPRSYTQRQCSEVMKLGLAGTTVVVSSGDDGVASFDTDPPPIGCLGPNNTIFNPSFLATCPYVLAVGATQLTNCTSDATAACAEVASTDFGSGGGFSNVFPRPAYQADAVKGYLNSTQFGFTGYSGESVGTGVFNTTGRGFPDVSAIGENFVIAYWSSFGTIGGTSLSAPIWAGLLTRVNEARLAAGKKTVGFVNPTLYSHPAVFKDVTVGSNPGCGTDGFPAKKGWDPVTGLGVPDYPALLKMFLSLP